MHSLKIKTAALLLFASNLCFAQDDPDKKTDETKNEETTSRDAKTKVVFGFKGGINRANVFDESGGNFVADSKPGYIAGAFVAIPIGGLFGFQPEIQLSQKGFEGSGILKNEYYLIRRTTTHLDIPLQMMVKPFSFLSFLGGFNYSYLIKQKDSFTFGPTNYVEQYQEFENDNIRKNTFGAILGLDINIAHFVISGRSAWDLISNHGDGNSSTPRYKNMWLQGTISYRFY